MDALDWVSEYERQPVRPVYAVFGADLYLIRESIRSVIKVAFPADASEAAISRFPGRRPPWRAFWTRSERSPFSRAGGW